MSKKKAPAVSPIKKSTNPWIFFGIISVVFFIVYQFIFDKKFDLGGDNAMYYILGKSISSGEGFKNIHFLSNSPHDHFPPGYPAILAIFMLISKSVMFLKVVNGLFLYGTVLMVYHLLVKFTENQKLAMVSSIVLMFNMHLLHYSTILMSEISFTFFTVLSLLLLIKSLKKSSTTELVENSEEVKSPSNPGLSFLKSPSFYFLIAVSSFAFHIRTAGIALVAGIILFLIINKNWKYLLTYITGFGLLAIPWIVRNKMVNAKSSYTTSLLKINPYRPDEGNMEIGDWFTRFFSNFSRYVTKEIPSALFPSVDATKKASVTPGWSFENDASMFQWKYADDPTAIQWVFGLLIISIIIYGLMKLKNYRILVLGYLGGTFGILLLWPDVWYGIRFVLPIIPFLLFLFVYGALKMAEFLIQKVNVNTKISPYIGLVFAFIFLSQVKDLNASARKKYPTSYKNYFEIGNYINKNLPQDAVISTRKPPMLYLFANRKMTRFPYQKDYESFLNNFDSLGVTHAVIEQLGFPQTGQYLVPVIQTNPEKFPQLLTLPNPDSYLLAYNGKVGYKGTWLQKTDKDGNRTLSVREGQGTFTYNDGTYYEGMFKNNLQDGPGVIKNQNGQIIKQGTWSKGQYIENKEEEKND